MPVERHNHDPGRRHFLCTALSSAVAGAAAQTAVQFGAPHPVYAQSSLTPDQAFQELINGNARFAANQLTSIQHDLDMLKNRTVDKQEPFAAVLSCADSRVPAELIFDQTIGHLFICRVAGNILTPEIIGSLEYGVAVLGVECLLVLGHANCGAVKAAMKADEVPGQISSLYPHLRHAVEQSAGDLDAAIEANVKIQANLLRTSSPVIKEAIKAHKLKVDSGVYNLGTGKVTMS
jgi:carbonic anhydrase